MSTLLYTRRAGAGKTDIALESIRNLLENDPIRQVWVLLPTELQAANFRARLYNKLSRPVFGVDVLDFYTLYTRLLQGLADPQRRIQDTARFRILRHVLRTTPLSYFEKIVGTTGFVQVVAAVIQEMKQARVYPEHLQIIARTPKDRELAAIYANYQSFLRENRLVDSEGEGWLALENVKRKADLALNAHLLIVDGFDQFTLVQAELLAALAERIDQVIITLTYEQERSKTALRRFGQTLNLLQTFIPNLTISPDESPAPDKRPEMLAYLSRTVFEGGNPPVTFADASPVQLIEAPDQRREVEEVLRRVKQLLRDGTPADQIGIVARDLRTYAPYLLELSEEYKLPIHMRGGTPLRDSPVVATLLKLIDLHAGDFRRLPVIEMVGSPYLAWPHLNMATAGILDQISRKHVVIHGKHHWLSAIRYSVVKNDEPILDDNGEPIEGLLTQEQATVLADGIDSFFTRITPPDEATVRDYVTWLEGIIGGDPAGIPDAHEDEQPIPTDILAFSIIRQIRANVVFAARDLAAMRCLRKIFREMIASEELIGWSMRKIPWTEFRRDLNIAIDSGMVAMHRDGGRDSGRSARVLVSTVYEARGLTHDHVFLLGLSEGQFPAPAREDSLYHDSERRDLNAALNLANNTDNINYFVTRADEADEKSLFYEMTAIPLQSLTLSRPYHENGSDWPASPYWKAVLRSVVAKPFRPSMSRVAEPIQAARFTELVTGLAESLSNSEPDAYTFHILEWIARHPEYDPRWQNAFKSQQMERLRASHTEGAHMGILRHPDNLEAVSEAVGAGKIWSASQLNELGLCPFQFFARRLLNLEEMEEPEPGTDALQTGNVIHAALQALYAKFTEEGLTITPDNWEHAAALISPTLTPVLDKAPYRFGFRPDGLWQQERTALERQITEFVAVDFSEDSPIGKLLRGARRSVYQEAKFGGEGSFILESAVGPLSVRGSIDRIDVVGNQAIVIDYKTGSSKHHLHDMIVGRDVQMLMYLEGARDLLQRITVSRGMFVYFKGKKEIGKIDSANDADAIVAAKDQIAFMVSQAREGRFPNIPGKIEEGKCTKWCRYSQLCRAEI